MKKYIAIIVLMALAVAGMAQEVHFDFSVTNATGYEIYYRITDAENHWVEATYPCQYGDNYWWGYDRPEGKLILSDTISHNGVDYRLTSIGDHAFYNCTGLRGALDLPETIEIIGESAFKGCIYLNGDLNIPAYASRIENEAFCDCSNLSGQLVLGDSLTFIGSRAFYNCSGLSGTLSIPNKVTVIGNSAFEQCIGFDEMVTLPKTLEQIGTHAFKDDSNIKFFNVKCQTPPVTATNAFDNIPTETPVYVPYNAKEAYQNASGWSRFGERIVEKSLWNGTAEPWINGNGTEDDPYLIESAENLAWLANTVNARFNAFNDVKVFQDTCFRLVIDLDLQRNTLTWNAIGGVVELEDADRRSFFSGVFDGNNHTISSYYVKNILTYVGPGGIDNEGIDVGLFASVSDAVISNLRVTDARINSNRLGDRCGGIAGKAINSDFYNCHFSGMITSDQNSTLWSSLYAEFGGIVGEAQCCRIEKCTSDIDMYGFENTLGGIVGVLLCDDSMGATDVLDCSTTGIIKLRHNASYAKAYVGGVVGRCGNAESKHGKIQIEHCYNKASIKGLGITDAFGTVKPPQNQITGGILGLSYADTLSILNCYSNHDIDIHETITTNYAGGIVGCVESGSVIYVKNCYHNGEMIAYHRGGVLAQIGSMTVVRNCYFDQSVAPDDGFGVPLSNDYMKTEAFVNRLNNGSTVFMMDNEPYVNDGYPVFGTDGLIFVGAEWYYEITNDDGSITYQHLECVGDTLIDRAGKRPKVIVRSNTHYDRSEITEVTHEYVYEENGEVYWWNKELQAFTLLYDFSAEEGDEWEIKVGSETIVTRVYEIETYMIDGIPYKKMTIGDTNNLFSGTLISTIGHLTSFFPENLMTRGKGYRVEGMRCYWLNGDLILKLGEKDCDEIYNQYHFGLDETEDATFAVYPNPTNGVLFVETHHGTSLQTDNAYRITNLMGQTLLQGYITAEKQQIDIANLPAGMYFINVGGQTVKFVVSK